MIVAMTAIDADRIRVAAGCASLRVESVDEIGSTNEALMSRAFGASAAAPTLLAAAGQWAGRGRRGRAWVSEPGRSVAFSIAFERMVRDEAPPAALSIAVGAAAAGALTPWAPDVRLKWPNDLQRAGRKLGGILVETRRSAGAPGPRGSVERIVVGIGVNLAPPRADERIAQPACGLFDAAGYTDAAETVIGCIAAAVVPATERFLASGLSGFLDAWRRFDALEGAAIVVLDNERVLARGVACGIDAGGGLRVRTDEGMQVWRSGEVGVRTAPVAGPGVRAA